MRWALSSFSSSEDAQHITATNDHFQECWMHDALGVLLSFTPFRDMSTLSENFRVVWWLSLPGKEDFQAFTFRLSENVRDWRLLLFGRVGKRRESDPGPCSLRKHHRWIYAGNLFSPFVACFFVVQPNKYDDQDSRKSDPKICKLQEHQRWMYGGNQDVDKILL